jgi:lipoprotein NlpD
MVTISGCAYHPPAPVINAWLEPQAQGADYVVAKGDTIYSIAWQFGLDYTVLAQANHLQYPYPIHPGQRLKMTNIARGAAVPVLPMPVVRTKPTPLKSPVRSVPYSPKPAKAVAKPALQEPMVWHWPAQGQLVRSDGHAGINIAGKLGSPVRASAPGEVVYSGNGIRGYGNLIIIKHDRHTLSAYAYTQNLQVRLGQRVRAGEQIAAMGRDDISQILLHFEIRYDGRPVDPLQLLR